MNSPALFRTVPSSPLRPPLPQDWGSQPQPITAIANIPGMVNGYELQILYAHSYRSNNRWIGTKPL